MRQTPANGGARPEAAIPGLSEQEGGPTPSGGAKCRACGCDNGCDWRAAVDRTLGLILERVGRVEDGIGSVAGDIANVMGELRAISRNVREDTAVRARRLKVRMQAPRTNAATSKTSDWQQCVSLSNAGDMVDDVATPRCPRKELPVQHEEPPGTEAKRPILVDLDNTSKESGDNNDLFGVRKRTPESVGKRVHSQPRLRVVPCAKKLLATTANAATGECSAGVIATPTLYAPKYKDPPGYENATDFGATEEPYFKPPLLQPKTNGVRPHPTYGIYSL